MFAKSILFFGLLQCISPIQGPGSGILVSFSWLHNTYMSHTLTHFLHQSLVQDDFLLPGLKESTFSVLNVNTY